MQLGRHRTALFTAAALSIFGFSAPVHAAGTDAALLKPATLTATAPAKYNVAFKTTAGTFVVRVTRAWAPNGADRIYNLVRHHFYDGAEFFRVVPGFVAQFGLSPNPAVNQAWSTATIPDDPVKASNRAGYLTFADSGPNTRTTQLFINLRANKQLDGMGFAPVGQVVSGMGVVSKLYSGYGEAPDQNAITMSGNAYLQKSFPKLDRIVSARIGN
jgi:peptidyl-prolyl cis-trans isomerase A (cyclophilin A)